MSTLVAQLTACAVRVLASCAIHAHSELESNTRNRILSTIVPGMWFLVSDFGVHRAAHSTHIGRLPPASAWPSR
eukprot:3941259-Rhodomonas_salina.2